MSKLSRFASQDHDDIVALARHGLIDAPALRQRVEAALAGYIGDLARPRGSIDMACRMVDAGGER